MLLGDFIHRALSACGITEDRVRAVWGKCNCQAWRRALNRLHIWARRVVSDLARFRFDRAEAVRHFNELFPEEK